MSTATASAATVIAVSAALGLCVGSFLNVVIGRLPTGRSIVAPPSACPGCGSPIAWYDNVPVLSFLLLRARCRSCRVAISWRYPLVELATAGLFALAAARIGFDARLLPALVLCAALVAITGIDLDHQIIPDAITLPGVAFGFAASLLVGQPHWLESLIGILLGGGLFFVIIVVSRGGMGGGDMKLGAMLGAFLGWRMTLVAIMIAVLIGGVVAIGLLATGRRGRKQPVPFGPFLAIGGVAALFWGESLLRWYLGVFAG